MEIPKYNTALIVGAGEGISASLARLFAKEGLRVALAARHIEKLGALCSKTGARAFACNAPEPDEVERLFGAVEREIAAPDVVVYNASARARGAFVDLVPADVAQAIAASAFGGVFVGAAGGGAHAAQQTRRDPVHRGIGQRQGLSAIRTLRDGEIRTARSGAKH